MRRRATKEQEQAARFISETLNNCHDEIDNLYEELFPDGFPISGISSSTNNKLRRFMSSIRENIAGIREYFKDNND